MLKVLSVAEKPSVAKELANIIGNGAATRRQGHSQYNQIFEVRECEVNQCRATMKITSVLGHVMGIDFEPAFKGWNSCNPKDLFSAQIKKEVKKEMEQLRRTLVDEIRTCDTLLLWLDCDLEGENIAFEVISICTQAKPRLNIFRARFSALIPRDIFRAMKFPDRPNPQMNDAVEARQEIDLRIGSAFTRFQSLHLQSKYPQIKGTVSYGPCQFPTLGFVVERSLKISRFKPEDFWYLKCEHRTPDPDEPNGTLNCSFKWERGSLFDRMACIILFDNCYSLPAADGERRTVATVLHRSSRPTSRQRPVPLNTVELQKRASRFFHMSSERTMHVAEKLYQEGILSYPRTETDFFKEGFDLRAILEEHRDNPSWSGFVNNLLSEGGFEWPRNGGHDDQAHPPIHPTKSVALNSLNGEEKNIYELVTCHFLACCAKDARGEQTTIKIEVGPPRPSPESQLLSRQTESTSVCSDDWGLQTAGIEEDVYAVGGEVFEATGLMILERTWLDMYRWEKWHANKVPKLSVGDTFVPSTLQLASGRTEPPPLLSESDLISEMDRHGIGTDATIATHIATIQTREYVVRDANGRFKPTDLGLALVEGYNSMGYQLNKPYLRASMEADCQKIARGQLEKETMVRACLTQVEECFSTCLREVDKLDAAMDKYFVGGAGNNNLNRGAALELQADQLEVVTRNLSSCGICKDGMDLVRVRGNEENRNEGPGDRAERRLRQEEKREDARRYLRCATCVKSYLLPRGEFSQHETSCPICQFQVLIVRNISTNKEHHVCPYCYRNPPGPPDSEDGVMEFRCFSCAHDCVLAGRTPGGEVSFAPCPRSGCDGAIRLRRTDKGVFGGCTKFSSSCQSSWWLPGKNVIRSVIPDPMAPCLNCSKDSRIPVLQLRLDIRLNYAPPGTPPECTVCPCCSSLWRDLGSNPLPRCPTAPPSTGYPQDSRTGGIPNRNSIAQGADRRDSAPMRPTPETSNYAAATTGAGFDSRSSRGRGRGGARGRSGPAEPFPRSTIDPAVTGLGPQCQCGQPSALKSVTKEGPNKGRRFYTCPKPREEQCKFFLWEEDVGRSGEASRSLPIAQGGAGGGAFRGSESVFGGRGGSNSGTMICSFCKQPGHYARYFSIPSS